MEENKFIKYVDLDNSKRNISYAISQASLHIDLEDRIDAITSKTFEILDVIKNYSNTDPLYRYFIKLLSSSISKNKERTVHPCFIHTLKVLSTDEVLILEKVHFHNYEFIRICDYEKGGKGFYNFRYTKYDFPEDILANKIDFDFYIFHLQNIFKLMRWPIYSQVAIVEKNEQTGLTQYSRMIETEFGRKFNAFLFD